jgi:CRISPR-associated protein Cas5t
MAHDGVRIAPALLNSPAKSTVLRTVWRVKSKTLGQGNNMTPVEQELLTGIELAMWVDSTEETRRDSLEVRINEALSSPHLISRFGALCIGESTHVVNEVRLLESNKSLKQDIFLLNSEGAQSLPVWVNHVGSSGTRYVKGTLTNCDLSQPELGTMPTISAS